MPRSAKSASNWDEEDLVKYNIRIIVTQNAAAFFGTPDLPEPNPVVQEIMALNTEDFAQATTAEGSHVLFALHKAMQRSSQESAVDDYSVALLRNCGFAPLGQHIQTKTDQTLGICRENRHAKINIRIVDSNEIIRLVQENKRYTETTHPSAQLIAEAIAAFDANNQRRQELGLPVVESETIPGIAMTWTYPVFYRIPVSVNLLTAVWNGERPDQETVVDSYKPILPEHTVVDQDKLLFQGMKPIGNRNTLLSCYEAFRQQFLG
jgi:hypothetical protein